MFGWVFLDIFKHIPNMNTIKIYIMSFLLMHHNVFVFSVFEMEWTSFELYSEILLSHLFFGDASQNCEQPNIYLVRQNSC